MQNDIVPSPSDVKPAPTDPAAPPPGDAPVPAPSPQPAAHASKPVEKPATKKDAGPGQKTAQTVVQKKKSDKPVGVIATAVILFTLLAGFAVYSGMSANNLDSVYKSASEIGNPNVEDNQQTPEANVDTVITETDGLQGDVQDLDPEVTDQALGL